MRQLVEDVEDGWYAGLLSRWCRLIPAVRGAKTVGGRVVAWALHRNDVAITHQSATDLVPQSYSITLLYTPLPSGGRRWWWGCPECERRVDVLYLPAGRDRLGCRRCCKLLYKSQFAPQTARRRRPLLGVVTTLEHWASDSESGRMRLVKSRRRVV